MVAPEPQDTAADALIESLVEVEFDTHGADAAVVVYLRGYKGGVQPVIWPMRLERTEQAGDA